VGNYVKGASFRGTPMREIRSAVSRWLGAHPELRGKELKALAFELMRQPLTEDKIAGILILAEHLIDELGPDDLPDFRALFTDEHLGDWSACDWLGGSSWRSPTSRWPAILGLLAGPPGGVLPARRY
jgi:hypothetical protein